MTKKMDEKKEIEEGFIGEDEEILSEKGEKELKKKLEYYGYIHETKCTKLNKDFINENILK